MAREGQEQSAGEDQHHHGDQDQVRQRDGEDRPVQVAAGTVEVDGCHYLPGHRSPQR